ncbi:MAG: hypothetical protein GC160_11465 [Acidobacteria bacterium]|nr:hypothetical protein [Acidobacteriota bacterium]
MAHEITWEKSFDGNVGYTFPDSSIEVYRSVTPDQEEQVGVILYDENGREVQTLPGDRIGRLEELRKLHDLAQKDVLGVNKMVDALLERLERAS